MKGTEQFKKTIHAYLEDRAAKDEHFAKCFSRANKNINDCITYILNNVKNSGCNGYADDEIYGMAVHYYDEEDIDIGNQVPSADVVVNHVVELSEEEKNAAREKARKDFEEIQLRELRKSQERKEAKEKKKQERLKKRQDEKEARQEEVRQKLQPTLF